MRLKSAREVRYFRVYGYRMCTPRRWDTSTVINQRLYLVSILFGLHSNRSLVIHLIRPLNQTYHQHSSCHPNGVTYARIMQKANVSKENDANFYTPVPLGYQSLDKALPLQQQATQLLRRPPLLQ